MLSSALDAFTHTQPILIHSSLDLVLTFGIYGPNFLHYAAVQIGIINQCFWKFPTVKDFTVHFPHQNNPYPEPFAISMELYCDMLAAFVAAHQTDGVYR